MEKGKLAQAAEVNRVVGKIAPDQLELLSLLEKMSYLAIWEEMVMEIKIPASRTTMAIREIN